MSKKIESLQKKITDAQASLGAAQVDLSGAREDAKVARHRYRDAERAYVAATREIDKADGVVVRFAQKTETYRAKIASLRDALKTARPFEATKRVAAAAKKPGKGDTAQPPLASA